MQPPGTILTSAGSVPRVFGWFYERWSAAPLPGPACAGRARVLAIRGDSLPPIDGTAPIAPGSEAASCRLAAFLERVDGYDAERDLPGRDATSHLSADLRFGTISPRQVVRAVGGSTPGRERSPVNWPGETGTRTSSPNAPTSSTTRSSRSTTQLRGVPTRPRCRPGNKAAPATRSSTPAMRELATTGWMPNRLRLITASFLVKDLLADWRIGERHFRHLLVDGDVPQNAGNWQWVAGTGPDAALYFRVLNPLTQARRFDPDGDYVRRFVPELAASPGCEHPRSDRARAVGARERRRGARRHVSVPDRRPRTGPRACDRRLRDRQDW